MSLDHVLFRAPGTRLLVGNGLIVSPSTAWSRMPLTDHRRSWRVVTCSHVLLAALGMHDNMYQNARSKTVIAELPGVPGSPTVPLDPYDVGDPDGSDLAVLALVPGARWPTQCAAAQVHTRRNSKSGIGEHVEQAFSVFGFDRGLPINHVGGRHGSGHLSPVSDRGRLRAWLKLPTSPGNNPDDGFCGSALRVADNSKAGGPLKAIGLWRGIDPAYVRGNTLPSEAVSLIKYS